jgi:hypothetical protein
MKSLYEEEVPAILKKIDEGITQRVESVGPDETAGVLEFIRNKILSHKGEYIRLPKIPFDLDKVDKQFLKELFESDEGDTEFYKHLMYQNWSNRFGDLVQQDDE